MIKIAIVDDNKFYSEDIKSLLCDYEASDEYEVDEYSDPECFQRAICEKKYDIVFLDIVFENCSGIDIGMMLNEKSPELNIIFVSAYPEYFKDVYKVKHSYFLTKEFERERFFDALDKAFKNVRHEYITVHTKKEKYKIILSDVLFFEGYLKHTRIYLTNGEEMSVNINIKEIEAMLPADNFVRTHQSFIVNMSHIEKYSRDTVFVGEKTVPISRTYINRARDRITMFMGGVL